VAVAVALATQENAHLAILEFVNLPLPPAGPWGGAEAGLGDLYNKFRDEAESDAIKWRERGVTRELQSGPCSVPILFSH
jgi:hypothetical protein